MRYIEEKDFILDRIKRACERFAAVLPKEITQKSEFDLVTEADKSIEAYLISEILAKYPTDRIVSEETHSNNRIEQGRTWILDPIDGTCNFARGIEIYGVQAALCDNGIPVASVLYLPRTGEEFYAVLGGGAYLNGKRIHVDTSALLQNTIVDLGDFSHRFESLAAAQLRLVEAIRKRVGKIKILGSACADFCLLAAGRTNAYVIMTDNLWDLVPGALLAREAGAVVSSLDGGEYKYGDRGIVAASTEALHGILVSALRGD